MLRLVTAALACALLATPATAQDYPTEPIRIIVPFGPGGGGDIVGRIFGQALQDKLGQPVVVENKPGAAGTIGNEFVARAEKDGYTIGVMTAGQIIAGAMNKSLRYDTATAFEPISQVGTASLMLVARADFPAANVNDLIRPRRPVPARSTSQARASAPRSTCRRVVQADGGRRHGVGAIPHHARGGDRAVGKQVDVLFDTVLAVIGQVQSGQLKAIAVTSKERFRSCRMCRRFPKPQRRRLMTSPPGMASSGRAESRRRSSPSSTRR